MIYIVHGENTAKSRNLIANQQKKLGISNNIEFNLEDVSLEELSTTLRSNSLFGDKYFIVLNITGSKPTTEHIQIFKNKTPNNVLVIYSEKNISKANILIKNADDLGARVIENTKEHDENMFKFIDTLFYKNRTEAYKEYQKLINADTDLFYLFSMIFYGLRSLAKGTYKSPSFEKGAPFTRSKVTSQLKNYTKSDINNIYDKFYNIEKKLKTGEIQDENAVLMAMEIVLNSK